MAHTCNTMVLPLAYLKAGCRGETATSCDRSCGDSTRLRSVPTEGSGCFNSPPADFEHRELDQFIPLAYHCNMLGDDARMTAFQEAIGLTISNGQIVLELGGGTGVLAFFAAQKSAQVLCIEKNPELVQQARQILKANAVSDRVTVVLADAFDCPPPEPVDVVICEMLHVGMLREMQLAVIDSFKSRYLAKFGPPLPRFLPEAFFQSVQPVQHSFVYHGYVAPTPVSQDPLVLQSRTRSLGAPRIFQSACYSDCFSLDCGWTGSLSIAESGHFNALRFITKNILTVLEKQQRSVDWPNQYLVKPLLAPMHVKSGQKADISFAYQAGDPVTTVQPRVVRLRPTHRP